MSVSTSLPTIPPSFQPATTSKDQRIRVIDTHGYSKRPHSIQDVARKNLAGARFGVWDFVWRKTMDWHKSWDSISVSQFSDALPYNEKTIRRTLNWMVKNKWLESRPHPRSQIKQYQLHPSRLQIEIIPKKDQRIRVENCAGGCAMIPHSLMRKVFKKLKGARCMVFFYVWEKTISQDKFTELIELSELVDNINYSQRAIINAITFLNKHKWLLINGDIWYSAWYQVHLDIFKETQGILTPYQAYLLSSHWKQTRQKALEKAENECETCGSTKRLEVHHLSYEHLGKEPLEDLQVLCHDCHTLVSHREVGK